MLFGGLAVVYSHEEYPGEILKTPEIPSIMDALQGIFGGTTIFQLQNNRRVALAHGRKGKIGITLTGLVLSLYAICVESCQIPHGDNASQTVFVVVAKKGNFFVVELCE